MMIRKEHAPGLILPVWTATQEVMHPKRRIPWYTIRVYGSTPGEAMNKLLAILYTQGVKV